MSCRGPSRPASFGLLAFALASSLALAQVAVELPDTSGMEANARQRLDDLYQRLRRSVEEGEPAPRRAEAYGSLGQLLLAYELPESARSAFAEAKRLQPEAMQWPYYLGVVLQTLGEPAAAAAEFERVLELQPGDVPSRIRLGNTRLDLNQLSAAESTFDGLLREEPRNAAALNGRGKVAMAQGDAEQAAELFARALELQPEADLVHYSLAQAYRRLGDIEEARAHLQQRGTQDVTFTDPLGSAVAWLTTGTAFDVVQSLVEAPAGEFSARDALGFALSQLGDVEGVVEQLEEILRQQSTAAVEGAESAAPPIRRARLHYIVGGLLVNQAQDQRAAEHFRQALELDPGLLDARVKLGNALARGGGFEAAIAEYGAVLELESDDAPALLKRGAAHMAMGNWPAARADLEALLTQQPDNAEGRARLGETLVAMDELEGAERHLSQAREGDLPASAQARVEAALGQVAEARGEAEAALEAYERALDLDPAYGEAAFRLGTLLGRQRRYEEAASVYEALLAREPGHVRARLGAATAWSLAGREDAAVDLIEAGLVAAPDSLELSHTLARLLSAARDRELRDGERAVAIATRVVESLPQLDHAETLAMALAEAGRFDEAVALQKRLVDSARQRGDGAVSQRLEQRLALYESGRPCC